jgi:phosphate transport system substrate-binding protein
MRIRWGIYALAMLCVVALATCARQERQKALTVKGSDTMILLGQRWAEKYMGEHPGAVIQVTGGGSGTGIAALINGTTDICQASRAMKAAERTQIQQRFGGPPTEIAVARDGLSIYVHESNPVREVSIDQLAKVYSGQATNWKDLGGSDAPIVLYGRENSSGTYEYFKEHVLKGGDFAASVQTLPGTAAVVNGVARDANGIGYGGAAYAKGVRELAVRADANSPAELPTEENVRTDKYPISRVLYFYTRKAPEGPARAFVDYVLSDSGQAIVRQVGYYSIR